MELLKATKKTEVITVAPKMTKSNLAMLRKRIDSVFMNCRNLVLDLSETETIDIATITYLMQIHLRKSESRILIIPSRSFTMKSDEIGEKEFFHYSRSVSEALEMLEESGCY